MPEYFEIARGNAHLVDVGRDHREPDCNRGEQNREPDDNEHEFPASR
ncbi:hypothetical protein IU449_01015 [Nocardia higoensis]|uniref:Uncharacterized protein n=1 Tax=Nocardia higoensis TaxID=228599 RepID=A0ABS0D3S3_9NOCA|nr:hypothetical protein [Nocardia higoensis]MBF6353142.1 hypothetical protein [Nocardia higoensis]